MTTAHTPWNNNIFDSNDIKPDIVNPKIGDDIEFEINANYMKELRRKRFACTDGEDAYEHVRTGIMSLREDRNNLKISAKSQSKAQRVSCRFGGNDATKKTQKALLKQQYENFNATSSESLDSIFNRLQKLVSRLAILGVDTPPEDLNVKFLRRLPSEWDTHVMVVDLIGVTWQRMKFKPNMALMAFTDSEVTDKSKRGFGYTAVPSPHPLILNRPTPLDLSYSGLEEFKQPEVHGYGPRDSSLKPTTVCDRESNNSKENTDDSLTQQPKTVTETSSVVSPFKVDKDWKEKFFHPANHVRVEEPKKARNNTDAPIIEDWVSDDEEEVESIPKEEKKADVPTATKKESPTKAIKKEEKLFVHESARAVKHKEVSTVRVKIKELVLLFVVWLIQLWKLSYLFLDMPDLWIVILRIGKLQGIGEFLGVGFISTQQMVINSPCLTDTKNWLFQCKRHLLASPKQTTLGKDFLNSLMANSLPKTIWLSIYLVVYNEELAIPGQTATAAEAQQRSKRAEDDKEEFGYILLVFLELTVKKLDD
ncbi:hypothetical protein Tco_0132576 [Tanacetum coccineum]